MAERVVSAPSREPTGIREAVCINTRKIFDSCRDKDCIEDLRVYPTVSSQSYIENSLSIRPKSAELLYVAVNVEPISFNRGHYTVDCSYFYRITGESFPAGQTVTGLAVFDKRVMLFGSEGRVKSFSSDTLVPAVQTDDMPVAVVDSVDPIALGMRIWDNDSPLPPDIDQRTIPDFISEAFSEPLVLIDSPRRWLVTIGQFSIIRLERDTQLLVPAYDYCLPEKECPGCTEDDPCAMFSKIRFPVEEFFPPDSVCEDREYKNMV